MSPGLMAATFALISLSFFRRVKQLVGDVYKHCKWSEVALSSDLHDERVAGHVGLFGQQLAVRVVESIPGRADHVDHVGVDHREVGEAPRGDAQHAQVVVQRRGAVFDLNALLPVVHRAVFSLATV